jgi:hypothetical protein
MKNPDQILDRFHEAAPWTRFDEWNGICIEYGAPPVGESGGEYVCAFFGEDQEADFKLLILRGADPANRYLQYRSGEWIPEFGLDFATTDGLKISIVDDLVESYSSAKPGQASEPLRLDEKQVMFEVLDAIASLVEFIDQDKVQTLGETEDYCYHLWKVANTWRADVREFPEENFIKYEPIQLQEGRISRINAAKLPREGVWEASPFFLPATRFQGDQEMFIQCAGVAERGMGLLGLVTLEAHADPEQEVIEALVGSIEKQTRIPQFVIVKEERLAERMLPIVHGLGIQIRLRKRLRELERIRDEMVESFPEDENEDNQ